MKKMTLQKIKERPWERKGGEVQWDPLDDDQKENNREEMSNQVPIVNVILINDKFLSNAVLVMRTHHLRDWCLQKNHSADNERAREEDIEGHNRILCLLGGSLFDVIEKLQDRPQTLVIQVSLLTSFVLLGSSQLFNFSWFLWEPARA
jgi:hypothetical protein